MLPKKRQKGGLFMKNKGGPPQKRGANGPGRK